MDETYLLRLVGDESLLKLEHRELGSVPDLVAELEWAILSVLDRTNDDGTYLSVSMDVVNLEVDITTCSSSSATAHFQKTTETHLRRSSSPTRT